MMTYEEALVRLKEDMVEEKWIDCIKPELEIAIKALEKQIPVKPIKVRPKDYRCPCCYSDVYGYESYCESCGQALVFNEEIK